MRRALSRSSRASFRKMSAIGLSTAGDDATMAMMIGGSIRGDAEATPFTRWCHAHARCDVLLHGEPRRETS